MHQIMLPIIPDGATQINESIYVYSKDDKWIYFSCSVPIYSHDKDDDKNFRFIVANMIVNGACHSCEIIRAFGVSKRRVARKVKQFKERGPDSFFEKPKYGKRRPTVLTAEVLASARELLSKGLSRRDVAEKLGVKLDTLKKAISDDRLVESPKPIELETSEVQLTR